MLSIYFITIVLHIEAMVTDQLYLPTSKNYTGLAKQLEEHDPEGFRVPTGVLLPWQVGITVCK